MVLIEYMLFNVQTIKDEGGLPNFHLNIIVLSIICNDK